MSYRWRLLLSFLVLICGIVHVLPSLPGTEALESWLPDKRVSLGLDLKGGIHLTLGVEVDKAVANDLSQTGHDLRRSAQDEGITILRARLMPDGRLSFLLPRADQSDKLLELIARRYPELNVAAPLAGESGGLLFTAVYRPAEQTRLEDMALEQAVRTIRNRIDEFGVTEPDIRKQSGHRIQIQLPGLDDAQRAIQLVGQTAHLTFHLVRDDLDPKGTLPGEVM
ncbi:MAG: protein translocase subunit SecD, partial [Deltaproteobacteria bacterium]|nr:protein translocase subunit SecD [Deltaproteobacteria bacterium]